MRPSARLEAIPVFTSGLLSLLSLLQLFLFFFFFCFVCKVLVQSCLSSFMRPSARQEDQCLQVLSFSFFLFFIFLFSISLSTVLPYLLSALEGTVNFLKVQSHCQCEVTQPSHTNKYKMMGTKNGKLDTNWMKEDKEA